MKKILLYTLTLFTFTALAQNNPCVPDESYQDSLYNLWPDTIVNLPLANVGEYYETHVQIKTPNTVGEEVGSPYNIPIGFFDIDISGSNIDSILMVELLGLPDGMSVYYSEPDFIYNGNSVGCVTLYGTPTESMIGNHDIVFKVDGWITYTSLVFNLYDTSGEYDEVIGYDFVVLDPTTSVTDFSSNSFQLVQNAPNPFNNSTEITFHTPQTTDVQFSVFNVMGKKIRNEKIVSNSGKNKIVFEANDLPSGIYVYNLSNGQEAVTKKMIISGR